MRISPHLLEYIVGSGNSKGDEDAITKVLGAG